MLTDGQTDMGENIISLAEVIT